MRFHFGLGKQALSYEPEGESPPYHKVYPGFRRGVQFILPGAAYAFLALSFCSNALIVT